MDKKLILLLFFSCVLFFANIGGTSVYILDEAKNAACAMEMHQRGDWVVPTFNNELRFDKPPLHYFFMKLAYAGFGITPFAARFFSSIMGVLLVLVVYVVGKRAMSKQAAFLAGLVLITSLHVSVQFHLAVPDPYLLFFLTAGLLLFYEAWQTSTKWVYYVSYLCFALATLAKGPVALVLPGLTVLIFLLTQRAFTWQTIKSLRLPEAVLILLVVAVPWYWLVHVRTGGLWTEQFFFTHNLGRFTKAMEGHGGFPLASLVLAFAALVPFSFFLPQAIREAWQRSSKQPFLQFSLVASLTVVLFFSVSRTILPTYVGPALPFLALILGYYFRKAQKRRRLKMMPGAIVYSIVACLLPVAAFVALEEDKSLASITHVAGWFVLFPVAAIVGLAFIYKKQVRNGVYAYVVGNGLFLLLFYYVIFPQVDALNPVTKSLKLINNKSEIKYYVGGFNPAFVFALQRPLLPLTAEEALQVLRSDSSAVIVSQTRYSQALPDSCLVFKGKDLFEKPVTVVYQGK